MAGEWRCEGRRRRREKGSSGDYYYHRNFLGDGLSSYCPFYPSLGVFNFHSSPLKTSTSIIHSGDTLLLTLLEVLMIKDLF